MWLWVLECLYRKNQITLLSIVLSIMSDSAEGVPPLIFVYESPKVRSSFYLHNGYHVSNKSSFHSVLIRACSTHHWLTRFRPLGATFTPTLQTTHTLPHHSHTSHILSLTYPSHTLTHPSHTLTYPCTHLLTHLSHTPHTPLTHPHTPLTHPHKPLTYPSHTLHTPSHMHPHNILTSKLLYVCIPQSYYHALSFLLTKLSEPGCPKISVLSFMGACVTVCEGCVRGM